MFDLFLYLLLILQCTARSQTFLWVGTVVCLLDTGSEICCSNAVFGRYWRCSGHRAVSTTDSHTSWCTDGAYYM